MKKVVWVFCIAILGALTINKEGVAYTWKIEFLEGGDSPSIVIDSNNNRYASFRNSSDNDVRFGTKLKNSTSWSFETVYATANIVGLFSSLAIDSGGNRFIAHRDASSADLNVTIYNTTGPSWSTDVVDSAGNVGAFLSARIDPSINNGGGSFGNVIVSYVDSDTNSLKFAKRTGSSWAVEATGDFSTGLQTSLAVGSDGNPHIAYRDTSGFLRMVTKPSGWSADMADNTVTVNYPSIAVDSSGNSYISYYDESNTNLKFAKKTVSTGLWTIETVDTNDVGGYVGQRTSIVLDSSNNVFVSYIDGNSDLKLAKRTGSGWTLETIGSVDPDITDITLNSAGRPTITMGYVSVARAINSFSGNTVYFGASGELSGTSLTNAGEFSLAFSSLTTTGDTFAALGTANSAISDAQWNLVQFDSGGIDKNMFYEFSGDAVPGANTMTFTFKIDPAKIPFGLGTSDLRGVHDHGNGTFDILTGTYNAGDQTFTFAHNGGFSGYGVAVNPEPITLILLTSGLLGLLAHRKNCFYFFER